MNLSVGMIIDIVAFSVENIDRQLGKLEESESVLKKSMSVSISESCALGTRLKGTCECQSIQ
jgi:hypothetical protein